MDTHRSRHAPPLTALALALVAAVWLLASAPLLAATRVNCPFDPKSLGDNVHFSITVLDTVNSNFKTYTNPDLNPAPPIQDTSALPCQ